MKIVLFLMMLIFSFANAKTITDGYGRVVTIPDKVTKIYAASPPLTMSLVAFDPTLVAALNSPFKPDQKPYVGTAASKPVAGGFFGQGNTPNYEVLAAAKPDVILMWQKAPGSEDQLKKFMALNIPVLMIHNESIDDLASQFELLGKITGNTKRAHELITYTKETLGLVRSLQGKINTRKKIRYYFAEGVDGMSSECEGSFHLEPFKYAGAKNALNCRMSSNYGMEKMSLETVILADPDVIIAMESAFASSIKADPKWRTLRAVKSGHILSVPNLPFNYITRPPSFMRLLGIRWLIHSFYPDVLQGSLDDETKRFQKLFFPKFKP